MKAFLEKNGPILAISFLGATIGFLSAYQSAAPDPVDDIVEETRANAPAPVSPQPRPARTVPPRVVDRSTSLDKDSLMAVFGANRIARIQQAIEGLETDTEFRAAIDLFVELSSKEQEFALSLLFLKWAQLDPASAMVYMDSGDLPNSVQFLQPKGTIMREWIQKNPQASAAYIARPENVSKLEFSEDMVAGLGKDLAKIDPDQALEWAMKLNQNRLQYALAGVIDVLADQDAGLAVDVFLAQQEKIGSNFSRVWSFRLVFDVLARKDPVALDRLVANLPDPQNGETLNQSLREMATAAVFKELILRDVVEAGQILAARTGEVRQSEYRWVAESYAKEDVQSALSWAQTIKSDEGYGAAIQRVLLELSRVDRDGAYDYVSSVDNPQRRSAAINAYILSPAATDFQRTAQLFNSVPEGTLSGDRLESFLLRWYVAEPIDAAAFVNEQLNVDDRIIDRLNAVFAESGSE